MDLLPAFGEKVSLAREIVPYAPSGLAAGSLKSLAPDGEKPGVRILAEAAGDCLVLVLADAAAKVEIERQKDGFRVSGEGISRRFEVRSRGREILRLA
jgi:hypothetical protein